MNDNRNTRLYHASPKVMLGTAALTVVGTYLYGERFFQEDVGPGLRIAGVTGCVLFVVAVLVVVRRARTLVTPGFVEVRGVFRVRRTAWSDVQAIVIQTNTGVVANSNAARRVVVLYDSHGAATFLPHVTDAPGAPLEDEVAAIESIWQAGRGAAWTPVPAVREAAAQAPRKAARTVLTAKVVMASATITGAIVLAGIATGVTVERAGDGSLVGFIVSPIAVVVVPLITFVVMLVVNAVRR